jgi:hypothetical protein
MVIVRVLLVLSTSSNIRVEIRVLVRIEFFRILKFDHWHLRENAFSNHIFYTYKSVRVRVQVLVAATRTYLAEFEMKKEFSIFSVLFTRIIQSNEFTSKILCLIPSMRLYCQYLYLCTLKDVSVSPIPARTPSLVLRTRTGHILVRVLLLRTGIVRLLTCYYGTTGTSSFTRLQVSSTSTWY